MCASVGIIVSLLTKPPKEKDIEGLTVFDVDNLKAKFKGSEINEAKGKKVIVKWNIDNQIENNCIRFSKHDMRKMNANPGDLVYLCDNRSWLGGLKSIHAVYGEPHEIDGVVMITDYQQQSGLFNNSNKLFAEKEM